MSGIYQFLTQILMFGKFNAQEKYKTCKSQFLMSERANNAKEESNQKRFS